MGPSRPMGWDVVPLQIKCRKQLSRPQGGKGQWPQDRMLELGRLRK